MIQIIDVKENKNIEKFNAAAKQARDHPETHGLLVKVYADWCGHCQNMTADWKRLIDDLTKNYECKKAGCVLTIANIQAVNLEPSDPVIQNIKYIPKDIQGVPTIMYVNKGTRGLEYSNERVYSEMLKWVVSHPEFALVRRQSDNKETKQRRSTLHSITKKARTKFKHFHRDTLKRFHKEMRRQHKRSVRTRMPTPVARMQQTNDQQAPAYLRQP
jgi:thiol-disulfide isomerase/thioredoxin